MPDAGSSKGDGGVSQNSGSGSVALREGGDCPELTGSGTVHTSNVTGDETWTLADAPHYVTSTIRVTGTLTVEACATVILSQGVGINVGSSTEAGKLITRGIYEEATATTPEVIKPVHFKSADENTHWGMLFVSGLGEAEFNSTVLQHGGDVNSVSTGWGGTLVARGPHDGSLRRMLTANLLVVLDSGGFGISLESGAGFKDSPSPLEGVLVQGSGLQGRPSTWNQEFDPIYPVFVEPPGIGTLPKGQYYGSASETFAANDMILVVPSYSITVDESFPARGVPYLIQRTFNMRPAKSATLHIDPGVELRFYHNPSSSNRYGMILGDDNTVTDRRPVTLDIQGTAEQPIVFTSNAKAPAPGDWVGLVLDQSPGTGNILSHAQILYAGADSQTNSYGCGPKDNDAAVLITNWRPEEAFIQNVAIAHSAAGGIVCGWNSDLDGPDLKSGNAFTEIANGCAVSQWQHATGVSCPGRTDEAPLCL